MNRKIYGIVALTFVLSGVVGVCAQSGSTPKITQTGIQTQRPTPSSTLTILIADLQRPNWINYFGGMGSNMCYASWAEYLLCREPITGELIPGLSERWEVSQDGKTIDFYLRKGVPFHDGWGEMTAEDVVWCLEKTMGPTAKATVTGVLREAISRVEMVDRYHIRLHLKKPNRELLYRLSNWLWDMEISCKKYVEAKGEPYAASHPIGTGPYKFVECVPGDHVTMTAVDYWHWRATPYYKTVIVKEVPEASTRLSMMARGQGDWADMSLSLKGEAEKMGVKLFKVPLSAYYFIDFGGAPLEPVVPEAKNYDPSVPWAQGNDPKALKVRKAMALAIDYDSIIKGVFQGEAVRDTGFCTPPGSKWVDPDLIPYKYDPKEAKRLLTEVGYPNGFEKPVIMPKLTFGGRAETPEVAEAVAMMWETNLGIKCQLRPITYSVFRDSITKYLTAWHATSYSLPGSFPEPFMAMTRTAAPRLSLVRWMLHYNQWEDPVIEIVSTVDEKRVVELHRKYNRFIHENYVSIPIAAKNGIVPVSDKVAKWGYIPSCINPHNFEYMYPAGVPYTWSEGK